MIDGRGRKLYVCVYVICLQRDCYSIFVLLCENCVDRTRKNVVMLVQSILQLNRSRFLLLHRHIRMHTYTTNRSLYQPRLSFSYCCCCRRCGKKSGIDKRLNIPSDKDNHSTRDQYYVKLFSSRHITFSFFCLLKRKIRHYYQAYLGFTEKILCSNIIKQN